MLLLTAYEPRHEKTNVLVSTRSDANQAVQPLKMARGWKFWIKVEEKLYYPYSENKGADQLRGYREADLRLCFRICKTLVFSRNGSYEIVRKPTNRVHLSVTFLFLFYLNETIFRPKYVLTS